MVYIFSRLLWLQSAKRTRRKLARKLALCWEAQQQSKDLGGLDQAVKVETRGWI